MIGEAPTEVLSVMFLVVMEVSVHFVDDLVDALPANAVLSRKGKRRRSGLGAAIDIKVPLRRCVGLAIQLKHHGRA
jgi:hypothetical protein